MSIGNVESQKPYIAPTDQSGDPVDSLHRQREGNTVMGKIDYLM